MSDEPPATPAIPVLLVAEDDKYDRMFLQQAVAEAGLAVDLKFVADGEQLLESKSALTADWTARQW
jgi:CheY-like chemotaxis protein